MNPELPRPNIGQELPPALDRGELQPLSPEHTGERSHEREQSVQATESTQAPAQAMPPMPPMPVAVPVPVTPVDNTTTSSPTIAADDDLIEKEWVDKAKKIITDTRDDPYKREQEISRLQADYLRKRYGKELGVSD